MLMPICRWPGWVLLVPSVLFLCISTARAIDLTINDERKFGSWQQLLRTSINQPRRIDQGCSQHGRLWHDDPLSRQRDRADPRKDPKYLVGRRRDVHDPDPILVLHWRHHIQQRSRCRNAMAGRQRRLHDEELVYISGRWWEIPSRLKHNPTC